MELGSAPMFVGGSAIVWDGAAWAVVWNGMAAGEALHRLWFARLSGDGEIPSPARSVADDLPAGAGAFHLFARPDGYALFYFEYPDGRIRAAALDGTGAPRAPAQEVATADGWSWGLAVAEAGDGYGVLVARGGGLFFQGLSAALAPVAAAVEIEAGSGGKEHPGLVWLADEGVFVALWRQGGRIRAARLQAGGAPAAPSVVLHDTGGEQRWPRAAPAGPGHLLVSWWEESAATHAFQRADTMLARDWAFPRHPLPGNRSESVDLAWAVGPAGALVAWQGNHDTPLPQIYVGRLPLPAGGELADTRLASDTFFPFSDPRAAASGSGFGLVFRGEVGGSDRLFLLPLE